MNLTISPLPGKLKVQPEEQCHGVPIQGMQYCCTPCFFCVSCIIGKASNDTMVDLDMPPRNLQW